MQAYHGAMLSSDILAGRLPAEDKDGSSVEKKNHSLKTSIIIILREGNRVEIKAKSLKAYCNPNVQILAPTTSLARHVVFVH